MSTSIHASAIAWHGRGVLIRGESGSGKSSLACTLLERGALLVGDDRIVVAAARGLVTLAPVPRLAGLLELRGAGLVRLPYLRMVGLALVVDLVAPEAVARLPDQIRVTLLGHAFPVLPVTIGDPLAAARVIAVLRAQPAR